MSAVPESTLPEPRPQAEQARMLAYVRENGYGNTTAAYVRGVTAALLWATGEAQEAPVTGRVMSRPLSGLDIGSEGGRAYEAMYATSDPALFQITQDNGLDYVLGIEHTLSWVNGSTALWAPWET
ncbi:hypothetical protein ACFPK5_00355 [Streptomyces beijiangensis]|uniref:hypothetical protein n=1 Tax=Streptomyces beijiangensis TaxID=163361 RepID=UPI0031E44D84